MDTTSSDRATALEDLPEAFNAADDLLRANLRDRPGKAAYICEGRTWTYAQLGERVDRFAGMLRSLGVRQEERIVLCLVDTIDFPTAFLGAIKAGVVPIPLNTLFNSEMYAFQLRDSRARVAVVSPECAEKFDAIADRCPDLRHIVVAGDGDDRTRLEPLLSDAEPLTAPAATRRDEPAFWLYTSGSTGNPKGAVHSHGSLRLTANLYGRQVLGIEESDVGYSVAKLFFAYGLGNALTFPLSVGATTVLHPGRPTPDVVAGLIQAHQVSILYGAPTFFSAFLAHPDCPTAQTAPALRRAASAGEALPASLGERFRDRLGVDVLDGLGSTEMLHIFVSQTPGDVRYGVTGKAVPGYRLRLVNDRGAEAAVGEIGDLHVAGPTAALGYWGNRPKSAGTFLGEWTRTGDKYVVDEDGYYRCAGRSDDMLKVSGIYVSPFDVEEALIGHPLVLEAAVVGHADDEGLTKPRAFVVLTDAGAACETLKAELKAHVKAALAPHAYPRWIEFTAELPKTATGKIQRFKLREGPAA